MYILLNYKTLINADSLFESINTSNTFFLFLQETSVYATIACHLTRYCIFNNQARLSNYMLI